MALLDAVVYPQPQGHFGYGHRDASYGLPWSDATGFSEWDPFLLASLVQNAEEFGEEVGSKSSPDHDAAPSAVDPSPVTTTKRKRRRAKVVKNEEEIESQRITHIAVERNRRRQMNEYLAVLRSLMPPSYAQRGDQASIVGGAINYVRELEQLLQSLEVQRSLKEHNHNSSNPFAGFFSFPQYSTTSASHGGAGNHTTKEEASDRSPQSSWITADIEASMVDGHTSVKVQARRRPRQLLRLAAGLQQLGLTTLHLNVSTAGTMVMYSFSLKVEDECKLSSVEEIAAAVHDILGRVQEEAGFS
ncbi:Transcription factor bHLH96 [Dichanthelium oligosanthes]|uniref:Transcription factor bHLH96 n=1 Tax=Dichanthelium oligosanthes TaxID=888268 RepID=A0A1E5WHQ8_9POAL|nr:Transcription factor bHLH96 [Dichanthelium oligosanthes]